MWIIKDAKQYITFIDPKSIRNLDPINNPKINLSIKIKEIEVNLGDKNTVLNSFIVSNTSYNDILDLHSGISKTELENKNVLFQVGSHKNNGSVQNSVSA